MPKNTTIVAEDGFYRFEDFKSWGLFGDRHQLMRAIRNKSFPRGLRISSNKTLYPRAEVHAWLESRRGPTCGRAA